MMINEKIYGKTIPDILEHIESFKGKTLVFFDTETTGIRVHKGYGQLTQIGAVAINGEDWSKIEDFNQKSALSKDVQEVLNDKVLKAIIRLISDPTYRLEFTKKADKTTNLSSTIQWLIRKIENPIAREYLKDYIPDFKTYRNKMEKYKIEMSKYQQDIQKDPNKKIARPQKPQMPKSLGKILHDSNYYDENSVGERVSEKELLENFENFVKKFGNDVVLIAHNAKFDMNSVETRRRMNGMSRMPKYNVFDNLAFVRYFLIPILVTLKDEEFLSKIKTKERSSFPYSASLGPVAKAMSIENKNWHDARADVEMMIQVMKNLIDMLKKNEKLDIMNTQASIAKTNRNRKF